VDHLPQLMSLSQGSLIVRSHELLAPGQKVQVTIHFIDSDREVTIDGEVVWANHQLGDMAFGFVAVSEGGREAIAGFLIERAGHR
jgi:Tfp pilus assembly protein PilZ